MHYYSVMSPVVRRGSCRALVLALALVVAGADGAHAGPAAPGFRLRTLDGAQTIDSRELIGKKIVVLRFQASYCRPCAREAAALNQLAARYRDRGVDVLAIHVQDTAADARSFVRSHKVAHPVALDPRLTLANRYGLKGTPYTVVIDRKGEIVARLHGRSAVTRLPRLLDTLLAAPDAARS